MVVPGQCQEPAGEGAFCNRPDQCQPRLTCEGDFSKGGICSPRQGAGGRCRFDRDCAEAFYCDSFPRDVELIPGTCRPRLADGAACAGSAECNVGSLCSNGVDAPGRAPPGPAAAGTCGPASGEGGRCAAHKECRAGLYCDGATGRCAPKKADGQACASFVECAATCHLGVAGSAGICGKIFERPQRIAYAAPPAPPAPGWPARCRAPGAGEDDDDD
jgi:hypothetical protein